VTTRLHLAPRLRKIIVISNLLLHAIIARTGTNTLRNIIMMIVSRKDRQVGQMQAWERTKNTNGILVGNPKRNINT